MAVGAGPVMVATPPSLRPRKQPPVLLTPALPQSNAFLRSLALRPSPVAAGRAAPPRGAHGPELGTQRENRGGPQGRPGPASSHQACRALYFRTRKTDSVL